MRVLENVQQSLHQEHQLRRAMLTKRAKLTLDSLLTSPRLAQQGTQEQATQAAEKALAGLPTEAVVTLDHVFEARAGVRISCICSCGAPHFSALAMSDQDAGMHAMRKCMP